MIALPDLADLRQRAQTALQRTPGPAAAPAKAPKAPPRPFPLNVGQTESLVDVAALAGTALILNNGTFIKMLEVAPVDLEQGDTALKHEYWNRFADALRRLRAPLALQIVVNARPQNLSEYLARWDQRAAEWQAQADAAVDAGSRARLEVMVRQARETSAFLAATHDRLCPLQQRYLVVIPYNPFIDSVTRKSRARLLDAKSIEAGLEKLTELTAVVSGTLQEIGLTLAELNPGEMCQALWEHGHYPGGLAAGAAVRPSGAEGPTGTAPCPSAEEFLAAGNDPQRLAELIAPEMVEEVESGTYVRIGEALARGYEIYDFDPQAPVDLASLLGNTAEVTYALYLEPTDPVMLRQLYKNRETELKASSLTDLRRGAVTDHSRTAAIQSVEEARADMETALQAPYFLRWYAVLWASDEAALEKKSLQLETQFKLRDLRFHRATRRHLSVVQSVRPVARPVYRLTPRNMSAESLGSFFPFVRRERFNPAGWHYGVHRGSGLLICLDPFEDGSSNASELILGAPRSGKSVYLKQQIETLLAQGDIVWYVDPEREGLPLAVDHHAPYLEMGAQGQPCRLPALDPSNPRSVSEILNELAELYQSLSGLKLSDAEGQERLMAAYLQALAGAGIQWDQVETWGQPAPAYADLVRSLREMDDPTGRAAEIGRVLNYVVALSGGHKLNIMDMDCNAENPYLNAAQNLASFVEAILGNPLGAAANNALLEAYETTMKKWGFAPDQQPDHPAPELAELYNTLAAAGDQTSGHLADVLKPYAVGLYKDRFNCQTNVDLSHENFVVFGLRPLTESAERNNAAIVVWQIMQLAWKQIVANSRTGRRFHLFIDEAWYVLRQSGATLRLEAMVRTLPKYSAALHLATHDLLGFSTSVEAQTIRDLTRLKVVFKQESEAAARSLGVFGLTEGEQASLTRLGKGEGWLLIDKDEHLPLYVIVNPLRLPRLSTNKAQMQAIARASGKARG